MKSVLKGRACRVLLGLLPWLNGCVSYAPNPVDWERERREWSPQNAGPMALSREEWRLLANVMNPEINRLRLRHAAQKKEARAAGWWEDPSLGVDVSRLLRGGGWTAGGSLSLALPLTGIPGLERRAAEAYAEEGWFEIALAEGRLAAEVDAAWLEIGAAEALLEIRGAFAEEAARLLAQAEALQRAGEGSPGETGAIRKAAADARAALVASRMDLPQKRAALLELAGVHPAREAAFARGAWTPGKLEWMDEAALVLHPAVMARLAAFDATEQELRVEIRKQYPELSLGPALERDDGEWRGGAVFGLTLPLWNRNRAGVAKAEGLRQEARQECLEEWRSRVRASHRLQAEIAALEAEAEAVRTATLPVARSLRDEAAALDALGESDLPARFEAAEALHDAEVLLMGLELRLALARVGAVGERLAFFKEKEEILK